MENHIMQWKIRAVRSYFRVYRFNRRTPDLLSRIRRWSESHVSIANLEPGLVTRC